MTDYTPEVETDMLTDRDSRAVTHEELEPVSNTLLQQGFRLALIAAHEEADEFRIVYLFTAGPPIRAGAANRYEIPRHSHPRRIIVSCWPIRTRNARPVRHHARASSAPPSARSASALAARLVPDA